MASSLHTKQLSRTSEILTLLEKRSLGTLQPKNTNQIYQAAIKFNGDFEFSRDLKGHFSCVNSLSFSHDGGNYLISGSDDRRILLWDTYDDIESIKPKKCFKAHSSNVFSAIFDSSNKHILSCGNDNTIFYYDVEYSKCDNSNLTVDKFVSHLDAVQSIAFDPFNDNIFLSASQDGTVKLWDIRKGKNHCGEIVVFDSMTFVQFSPVTERQFVTSSNSAFSKKSRIPFLDDSDDILVKYITTLSKNNKTARPDISSVTFHPSGTMLCAMISRYHPTLYDVAEETPLCIFSSNYNKESNTCYSNKGTFKQAHFGGPNGDYILTGSDDFRVYVWKIPDLNLLKANKEISPTTENDSKDVIQDSIIKIYENSNPEYVLGGHRSIVNTVLWHPHLPYIFSSEKLIKIYSAFPFSDNDNEPKEAFKQREKYPPSSLYHIFGLSNSDLSDSIEEDVDTLRFFDNILRIEQNNDPYWGPNSNNNNSSTSSNSTTNPFINQLPWDWHNRNFHNHFTFPTFEDFNRLISSNTNSTIFGEDDDYRSFILDEDEDDYISNLYEEEEADDDDDEGDDYALSFERFFAVTREIVGGQMRRDSSFTMD
ncbi:4060_t:CDS:10, partial [Entrophospora sp. SA101]